MPSSIYNQLFQIYELLLKFPHYNFSELWKKLTHFLETVIVLIILSSNDHILKYHDSIQQKKFNKLLRECKPKQDPEKIVFNFSNVTLT